MEWDEDEIEIEITADVVEVEIAETAGTDVSIDEEKIELEIAAPEENTLEFTDDLIELELIDEPEIVIETGEGSGKAVWGFITGELPDQTDLAAALDGKSDVGHIHDDRYYTEQEIDAALQVINTALSGKSDVGHVHDDRYYTETEIDAALAVINAALSGKSDTGHVHDDRYYTETEIDAALQVINTALAGKSDTGHTHDDRYYTETETDTKLDGKVSKSGDTMTGDLTLSNDKNLLLKPSGASSNASGDIVWYYGSGQEKMRLWGDNSYSAKKGPFFRVYKTDGTQLFNGTLSLSDHTHDDRYYTESETDTKLDGKANSSHTHSVVKRIIKSIGDVTMGSRGYVSVASSAPDVPSGYTFMFCVTWDWGNTSNPNTAFGINASGNYMYGGANSTITNVKIAYFYVLNGFITSQTV